MKKALIIGIDNYHDAPLNTCVNDAKCVGKLLSNNADGSKNFDVKYLLNDEATRANVRKGISTLFKNNDDTALLYFSGHGVDDENDGFICTYDYAPYDFGISMPEIIQFVNKSKCKNKIVIFDCCYSGAIGGANGIIGDQSILAEGTVILTASRKDETSVIRANEPNSLFTRLFVQALEGTASNIFGETTPSSIYAFIDKSLAAWEQRPFFKSNVSSFISLRKNEELISVSQLKEIVKYFDHRDFEFPLDPTFESTNTENSKHYHIKPYAIEKNCAIFKLLLQGFKVGLVTPNEAESMYYAAMENKSCKLTKLGQYYFDLVKEEKI